MNAFILVGLLSFGAPAPAPAQPEALVLQDRVKPQTQKPATRSNRATPRSTAPRSRTPGKPQGGPVNPRHAGYALDASLEVGAGGYNRPTANSMARQRYSTGKSQPIYRVSGSGEMVYDPNAAFNTRSTYSPAGGRGANHRRFRYSP